MHLYVELLSVTQFAVNVFITLSESTFYGVCYYYAEADPRINGVIKVAADFNVIDNEHKFKRYTYTLQHIFFIFVQYIKQL